MLFVKNNYYCAKKQELKTFQKTNMIRDTLIENPNPYTEPTISAMHNEINNHKSNPYKQAVSSNVYMYSAILIEDITHEFDGRGKVVIVNGWEKKVLLDKINFTCCFYREDNTQFYVNSTRKSATFLNSGPLHSVQYMCPVNVSSIRKVSVSEGPQHCVGHEEYYIKVDIPIKSESGLAVCSKISYGNMDAKLILEWFEVQRLLGVDKVLTYTYKLNMQAMVVLEYYESIGYAEIIRDFDFPQKEEMLRNAGDTSYPAWVDLQVIMHDCQSRLYGYKYVAVLDKDEFYVPNVTKYGFSLKQMLDKIFENDFAGVQPLVKMHMTSWKPSNESSDLFLGKYLLSTAPVNDRLKFIHMPSRTKYGSVEVHTIMPVGKYKSTIPPVTQLVLHHYRKCRKDYAFSKNINANERNILFKYNSTDDKCFGFKTYYQKDMELIIGKIRTRVLELQRKLLCLRK
ncbi:unnamed protein product [Mytilus coruscus]|uniref:Glycosyltransferase family 92 protein n=1 Tax=Mytilus coruscus TaxID=42192 RepID=A0A6J8APR4_MYTCO|nr:unnamed protein product [Mytilus coruscus]